MSTTTFNRDSWAGWYAQEHLKTDPGIVEIHYLPTDAGERDIRFVEVNSLIGERTDESLEPIDFGIDTGTDTAHKLFVLDVTPRQWQEIQGGELQLPLGWSFDNSVVYTNE